MLISFINWLSTLFTELGKIGEWLFTPIDLQLKDSSADLSQNGIILESSSASVNVYNFFVRLFTNNWNFSEDPGSFTIIPIYLISAGIISAILIAMFIKVWFRR